MNNIMSNRRVPFVPLNGGVGLLEKRLDTFSGLLLDSTVSLVGDFNHGASNTLLLDSDATPHTNHGSDPGSDTMALVDSAAANMERPRVSTHNMALTDTVHVSLDGHHPDTSIHTLNAGETINVGMAVYIPTSNTANLATANSAGSIESFPVGLANSNATVGTDVEVLCEGSVYQADWSLVTGTATLTVGAWYFLSDTDGMLTTTAPSTDNHIIIRVGRAITETLFDIEISDGVVL